MTQASLASYDEFPYHSAPYAETHPRSLRTAAALLSLPSAPLESARVLELGCAGGGNLIPIAEEFPQARFVGVDLSAQQIAAARQRVTDLGLTNVDFRHQSILDIQAEEKPFDYIICHGILSWVPADVRQKIFEVCRDLLAPTGLAVISFNAYPGCHARDAVRNMMKYHVANISDPHQQISESQAMLRFLREHAPTDTAFGKSLAENIAIVESTNDEAYFFHDYLEEVNQPFYLHEFQAQLVSHELQLVAAARFDRWQTLDLPPKATGAFDGLPYEQREQYIDFLRNTQFHTQIVARRGISPNRSVQQIVSRLAEMHFRLKVDSTSFPRRVVAGETLEFPGRRLKFKTSSAIAQAALLHLAAQPAAAVGFAELARAVGANDQIGQAQLARELWSAIGCDLLDIFAAPPTIGAALGERPQVANNVRLQAAHGHLVTNRCHRYIRLDDFGRFVAIYLDGQHDRAALLGRVEQGLSDGRININEPSLDRMKLAAKLPAMVDESIAAMARSGVLVA